MLVSLFYYNNNAMAQVRKYAPGGIFVDGVQLTEEQINKALTGASAEARAQWAETLNAARSGQRVDVDSNANSVVNGRWENSLTDKQLEKNTTGNLNRRQRNRHARWNTDIHNFNKNNQEIISAFKTQLNVPTEIPKEEELKTTALGYGSGWFYDENGKYKGSVTGANNEKIIRDVFKYLGGDETYRKGWTTDNYGADLNGLVNWYSGQDVEELINRIKSNSLTADDKDVLQRMGFTENPQEVAAREQNAKVAALKNQFQTAGLDYDKWSGLVEFDDKGRMIARKDANGNSVFSAFGDGNLWFNDSFVNKYKQYDFLKDHFLIDGVLYKASDAGVEGSELYKYLHNQSGFYDLNKAGDWEGANKIIRQLWNGETNNRLGSDVDVHVPFLFNNPNYRWASLTGAYDAPLAEGEQLLEIYDPNGEFDMFGHGKAKYAIIGKDGKERWIDSPGNLTGREASALDGRKIARTEDPEAVINGLVIEDITDKNNNQLGVRLFRNPVNGDWVYRGRIRGANGVENMDYKMPSDIAEQINKNPEFWNKLASDPDLQRKFENTLGDTVNSGIRTWFTDILSANDWDKLEFNGQFMFDLFKKYRKNDTSGDRIARRDKRLVEQQQVLKNGGKVLPKFQPGGSVKSTATNAYTQKKLNSTYRNPANFAKLSSEKLSAADKWELAAIIGDLGGVVTGWAGLAGTVAGFGADIVRDGLDWKDIGNLGVGLGLDAMSLIKPVGSAAQAAQAVNRIRKATPTIMKLFSLAGIGQAGYVALDKINSGEDWNMRDIRMVMSALTSAVQLGRSGVFNRGRKPIGGNVGTVKAKVAGVETDVKLNDADMKAIQDAGENGLAKFKEIAARITGKPADQIELEALPTKDVTIKGKRNWKKFGKREESTTKKELDFNEKPNKDKQAVDPNSRSGKRSIYNDALRGEYVEGVKTTSLFGKPMLRVSTPNLIPFGREYVENPEPEGYVTMPTAHTAVELGKRARFAKGGRIVKGNTGLDMDKVRKDLYDSVVADLNKDVRYGGYSVPTMSTNKLETTKPQVVNASPVHNSIPVPELPKVTGTGNIQGDKSNFNFGQYLDPAVGAASLAYSINQTNRIADINKDTANKVAQASIMSRPEMEAKRNSIIAGNAYRNQAKRQFDALPPVNSDYLKYAAMKRVGDDMANQYLLQADLADSQEYNQNQAWNSEAAARYHEAVRQTEAHNRQVEGQRLAAIGQFEVARRQANAQSINNSAYEFRNRLEQAKQAADSKKALERMFDMENAFNKYKNTAYLSQYNTDPNKDSKTYEEWLSNKPEYMRDITDERSRLMQKWKLESVPQHWLSPLFAKSGTKLRPSKEQIEINRRKAQDQAWVNQNKATQKALAQLTKQAHEFLKMMLS